MRRWGGREGKMGGDNSTFGEEVRGFGLDGGLVGWLVG